MKLIPNKKNEDSFGAKVFLHIGYGKTGSSAIQSFLARNSKLLSKFDVDYPYHPSFNLAVEGRITSGNLDPTSDWSNTVFSATRVCRRKNIIFSNEGLYGKILHNPDSLIDLSKTVNLTVILYVRDPFDLLHSIYGQQVKRGGETKSILEFLPEFIRYYKQTPKLLMLCKSNSVNIVVRNYSRTKELEKDFMSLILGQEASKFSISSDKGLGFKINRSLDRAELELQRQFNHFFGANSSEFISDQLVNNAPEITSENQEIDPKSLNHLKELLKDDVNLLNSFLDERNQIIFNSLPSSSISLGIESNKFIFTQKQIEIFSEAISKKILSIQASVFVNNDADKLRNIALKYENGL